MEKKEIRNGKTRIFRRKTSKKWMTKEVIYPWAVLGRLEKVKRNK
jgi:hypothetical protein